jgi:hypothetical protein
MRFVKPRSQESREKNRIYAREHRAMRAQYVAALEARLEELMQENAELRNVAYWYQ